MLIKYDFHSELKDFLLELDLRRRRQNKSVPFKVRAKTLSNSVQTRFKVSAYQVQTQCDCPGKDGAYSVHRRCKVSPFSVQSPFYTPGELGANSVRDFAAQ